MSLSRRSAWLLFLCGGTWGCRDLGSSPELEAVAPSTSPTAADRQPLVERLPERASALLDRGRPLEALALLDRELAARLRLDRWSDPLIVVESELAARMLHEVAARFDAPRARIAWLEALGDELTRAPANVSAPLFALQTQCLRAVGRIDAARAATRALGFISDWRLIGPFDNERGAGFDTAFEPETRIDFAARPKGKLREVAWRDSPGREHPLGRLLLHEVLRPTEQVVAYAATAVHSQVEREVLLSLSTSGDFKLFCNGREVLARKVERQVALDQDRAVLALAPGWNVLLLKLGNDAGAEWRMEARLTELDGRPLRGCSIDASRAEGVAPEPREPCSAPSPVALALLEGRGDARALGLFVRYHLLVHAEDRTSRVARSAAERLRDQTPESPDAWYTLARTYAPDAALALEEREVRPRLQALQRTLELEPTHFGAALELAAFHRDANPVLALADRYSAMALTAAPESAAALELRAEVLTELGLRVDAERLRDRSRAAPESERSQAGVVHRAAEISERGDPDGALRFSSDAWSENQVKGPILTRLLGEYAERGDLANLADTLERFLAGASFDTQTLLFGAELAEDRGDLELAERWVARALAIAPEHVGAWLARARLAERRDDALAADAALAEVLRLQPGQEKVRRKREFLAKTVHERFESPYRWDARELAAENDASGANELISVPRRTVVWRVEEGGIEHRYEHLALRVENQRAVELLDRFPIEYPFGSSLQVENVRVIRRDGSTVRATPPRRGDLARAGGRARSFDLPPLSVGDLIDIEYRVDQTQADVFGEYFGLRHEFYADLFDGLAPTRLSELVVISPEAVPLFVHEERAAGLERSDETQGGTRIRRWVARELPHPPLESAMPDRGELAPQVDVTSYRDWDAFARWWWGFIEKEFVTTPAMRAKVAELCTGLATEREKVQAIAHFVGQEIRYNSWPFGTHGYEPFSAATVFERRFGDCKDKSILLRQMLSEIGVRAHPVLIRAEYARPEEGLDAALVEHFNHCIAYVEPTSERPGYYLDATADRNPIDYLRADDQGARVLHVDAGGGRIAEIPYAPPEQNALRREYAITLDVRGAGAVHLEDRSSGAFGVALRHQFGGEQGDLAQRVADALAGGFGVVEVRSTRTSRLEDIGAPAELDVDFAVGSLWTREERGASLRLGFDPLPLDGLAIEADGERSFDLVLDRPFVHESQVTYRLPEGARVVERPSDSRVEVGDLLEYQLSTRESANQVSVTRRFVLRERRIRRERYAEFRAALEEIRRIELRSIRLSIPRAEEDGR